MSKQPRTVGIRLAPVRTILIVAMATLLLLSGPVSVMADPTFTFRARGNGHGVGMSQYGARGFAMQGYSYSHILRHYYTGTSLSTVQPGQTMRVALQATDTPAQSWDFTTHNAPMRVDWSSRGGGSYLGLNRGVRYRFSTNGSSSNITITDVSTGGVIATLTNVTWVHLFEFDTTKPNSTGLTRVHNASGPQSWTDVIYPGWIRLDRGTGSNANKLHLRNRVQLEDYVKCVVPREMPASWSREAVKAQSVAARSYAFVSKRPDRDFDVWSTVYSQVYNGWGRWLDGRAKRHNETSPGVGGDWLSDPAVNATAGQVVTHDGKPVSTYFFSTSGGYTEHSENVWSAALPYTRGVPDPFEYLAGSPAHTHADITLKGSELRSKLVSRGFTSAELPGTISGIQVLERGVSGRVLRLRLLGAAGDHKIVEKARIPAFRTALSDGKWNTTWFYVNPKTVRVAGKSRYDTAVVASKAAFSSISQVVLVGGHSPTDALSAAAFAGSLPGGAPILLTEQSRLTPVVKAEIQRLGASKVYIVGGDLAVSSKVDAELRTIPVLQPDGRIERIAGANRYDTARLLANRVLTSNPGQRVFVVNGQNLADSLAISPVAYSSVVPIVPVRAESIPAESAAVFGRPGVTRTQVVGGEAAVSQQVFTQLPSPTRIAAGVNRYDTAAKLAAWAVANENFRLARPAVASGISSIDALAAAPLLGRGRHSVLFSATHTLPAPTRDTIAARKSVMIDVRMLGGEVVLGNGVEAAIERALD